MKAALLLAVVATLSCARKKEPAPPPPSEPARILGISHMALYVSDLKKSRAFYKDFLGFDEPYNLKRPDGTDRIAFIKINEQQYVELFDEPPKNDGRVNHIALYTNDAEGLNKALAARGVPVTPVTKGKIGNSQFGVSDPDHHNVEITEYEPGGWTIREKGKFMPESRIATRIAHLGVLAKYLDSSLAFYGDRLGFEDIWRGGPSATVLSWVNLRVPDGRDYLELMLYDKAPRPEEVGGKNHICLEVPDVAAALARLEARPARREYQRPLEMKVGINRKRQANLFDPDGTRVELMEPNTIDGKPTPSSTAPPPRR